MVFFKAVVIIFIIDVLSAPYANGDQIVPSDRVSTHVNVRQNPIAGSTSVGTLAGGQTAELLDAIPYPEKNIIALGDFNANPYGQPHHFDAIITGTSEYRVLINEPLSANEPSLRTTIQQKNNPEPDYFLSPVYDHILISAQTNYALPNNPMTRISRNLGIVEFDQDGYWMGRSWNEAKRAMSDHRPVWFRVDYNAADLD